MRNSFRYASKKYWSAIAKDLKPIYTAVNEAAANEALAELRKQFGSQYPGLIATWERAREPFIPFLEFHPSIRKVIYTTNAIESINARFRRAVNARGHFPTEQAALKCVYLVLMSLDPTGKGRKRWMNRWKPALNAFEITFEGRLTTSRK